MNCLPASFVLPDLISLCPFLPRTNPHFQDISRHSHEWMSGFDALKNTKRASFIQGENELLSSYVYPYAGREQLRGCCDFINLLFVVDEISDIQDGKTALHTGLTVFHAMSNADFDDGSVVCIMTKEVRNRLLRNMEPACFRRFLKHCKDYVVAVGREAELRELDIVLDIESYQNLRRDNSAIWVCFGLFGYALGLDLPDEILDHEVMASLYRTAADMVCWANDLYSYNMEQAMGHKGNNILTVLMQERDCNLQEAADFVGNHFKTLVREFQSHKTGLPTWGNDMDKIVSQYVLAMEDWVIGNLNWSFHAQRYFGTQRANVAETLVVELYPQ